MGNVRGPPKFGQRAQVALFAERFFAALEHPPAPDARLRKAASA